MRPRGGHCVIKTKNQHDANRERVNVLSEWHAAAANRKVFIKTFGCQMNVYDSERMAEALAPMGYAQASRWTMPTW